MTGGRFSPATVRGIFLDLARSIPQNAEIRGSYDVSNPHEILTSFAFDGNVIGLSVMKKGGAV